MPIIVSWILFSVPLVAVVLAWVGLHSNWNAEQHRFSKVLANVPATAAPLLACAALWYVQFVRPIPAFDHTVERWGLMISFFGIVSGFIACRFATWFSKLSLGVSAWMFVLYAMSGLTS
jgi:hypothetical protein